MIQFMYVNLNLNLHMMDLSYLMKISMRKMGLKVIVARQMRVGFMRR